MFSLLYIFINSVPAPSSPISGRTRLPAQRGYSCQSRLPESGQPASRYKRKPSETREDRHFGRGQVSLLAENLSDRQSHSKNPGVMPAMRCQYIAPDFSRKIRQSSVDRTPAFYPEYPGFCHISRFIRKSPVGVK
ncbi:MAG: hypothetical protein CSA31_01385 [Desulfobulbus propionicus]|nr:MAG: hypothetical protein CSA31_01385 [Desulfobulbus propionicus]